MRPAWPDEGRSEAFLFGNRVELRHQYCLRLQPSCPSAKLLSMREVRCTSKLLRVSESWPAGPNVQVMD
jgi:hypothetical protein